MSNLITSTGRPKVVRGGKANSIGNGLFYMTGKKHSAGGIDIGKSDTTGIEVEGGEVVQNNGNNLRVFSSIPFLDGISPAQRVMRGDNPDLVFNAQERFKAENNIADDGTKFLVGGRWGKAYKSLWPASPILSLYNGLTGRYKNKNSDTESAVSSAKNTRQTYDVNSYYPNIEALRFIKNKEGFRDSIYHDANGVETIGFGTTKATKAGRKLIGNARGRKITEDEANMAFNETIREMLPEFIKSTPNIEYYNDNQRDALFSYFYNIGPGNYTRNSPKFQQALRDIDLEEIKNQMDFGYTDTKNPGLKIRRDEERAWFDKPIILDVKRMGGLSRSKDYGSSKKPYPNVSSDKFAGPNRTYPIPTKADARDALRLAGLHGNKSVTREVLNKYPSLAKKPFGGQQKTSSPKLYEVVKKGDNLSKIADRNGINLQYLLYANPQISNPDLVQVGDTIDFVTPKYRFTMSNKVNKSGNPEIEYYNSRYPDKTRKGYLFDDYVVQTTRFVDPNDSRYKDNRFNKAAGGLVQINGNVKNGLVPSLTGRRAKAAMGTGDDNGRYPNGFVYDFDAYENYLRKLGYSDKQIKSALNTATLQQAAGLVTNPNLITGVAPAVGLSRGAQAAKNAANISRTSRITQRNTRIAARNAGRPTGNSASAKVNNSSSTLGRINTPGREVSTAAGNVKVPNQSSNTYTELSKQVRKDWLPDNVKQAIKQAEQKAQYERELPVMDELVAARGGVNVGGPEGALRFGNNAVGDALRSRAGVAAGIVGGGGLLGYGLNRIGNILNTPADTVVSQTPVVVQQHVQNNNGYFPEEYEYTTSIPGHEEPVVIEYTEDGEPVVTTPQEVNIRADQNAGNVRSSQGTPRSRVVSNSSTTSTNAQTSTIPSEDELSRQRYEALPESYNIRGWGPNKSRTNIGTSNPRYLNTVKAIVQNSSIPGVTTLDTRSAADVARESRLEQGTTDAKLNRGDYISAIANAAGALIGYIGSNKIIKSMKQNPNDYVRAAAAKLRTRYDINPQLDTINLGLGRNDRLVRNNTASSQTGYGRRQLANVNAVSARNELYGTKYNQETQLINQDRTNWQNVGLQNAQMANTARARANAYNYQLGQLRLQNLGSMISTIAGIPTSLMNTLDQRRYYRNTIDTINARNQDVDRRMVDRVNWQDYIYDPYTGRRIR